MIVVSTLVVHQGRLVLLVEDHTAGKSNIGHEDLRSFAALVDVSASVTSRVSFGHLEYFFFDLSINLADIQSIPLV